jgi:glycosyltransferase involved in cell wall biosynthesis
MRAVEAEGGSWAGKPVPRIVSVTPTAVERDSRTFRHAASIARLGYESIVVEGRPSARGTELPFELLTADDGTEVRRSRQPSLRRIQRLSLLMFGRTLNPLTLSLAARRTWRRLPPANLYYLHAPHQFLAVAARSRRSGVPFIYDAHDLYYESDLYPTRREQVLARLLAGIERRCVRRAAAVSTTTHGFASAFERRFGFAPTVILNSDDPRLGQSPPNELRKLAGVPAKSFLLLIVGNYKPFSAFSEVLEAVAALPDEVHLAVVGSGWEPRWAEVVGRELDGRVHHLAPVLPTQVASFIRSADASLIEYGSSSRAIANAVPNRFFHSVAAGLPLLYPSLPEIRSLANRYRLGIEVDPCDANSVTRAVTRLRTEPGLLDELRGNVTRALPELSWEREEPKVAALIESALTGH